MNPSRLLIVDDEEMGREVLSDLLTSEGYRLSFAANGKEALREARREPPDLILLDVMMPGLNGFEVCRQVREDPLLAEVPVILVTVLDDRNSRIQGIEAGADAFVSKPFDRVELRARIRSTIQLNRYRRLLTERAKFEWVVEHAQEGYLLLNKGGEIHYANQCARDFLYLDAVDKEDGDLPSFLRQANQVYQLEPEDLWRQWPMPNTAQSHYLVKPESREEHAIWLQVDSLFLPSENERQNDLLVRLRDVSAEMNMQQQTWSFQALVSHKLRTPLMGLQALKLLRRELSVPLSERGEQFFRIAEENVERLEQQIQEILSFIDAPRFADFHYQPFSLSRLPELLAEINQEMGLEAKLDMPVACSLLMLPLAEEGMRCILSELFANAKKFHPEQRPCISVHLQAQNENRLRLQVIDNGRHIPLNELRKIWLPYFQSEKIMTGEVGGTGLGLPTIASIIWGLGGQYHLRNRNDGPGVIVELQLPLQTAQ